MNLKIFLYVSNVVIWFALMERWCKMKQCCKDTFNKVPDDEPVFTLLGRDLTAIPRIADWINEAKARGVNEDKINRAQQHLNDFVEFQHKYPERCKFPD
jgi:hypothetical protein